MTSAGRVGSWLIEIASNSGWIQVSKRIGGEGMGGGGN